MLAVYVGIGGFLGAIARFFISGFVQKTLGITFPVGTLCVNVLGSFLIGFLVMVFEYIIAPEWKALLITGFLGALTTFSTFSYETVVLIQEGLFLKAFLNVIVNVTACLTATAGGIISFKLLFKT